jgi:predicted transporter
VCDEVLEIGIRLLLKIICVVLGFGTATIIHGNSADLTGSILFLIGTFGALAGLRPLAYRLYPTLKQSDLRRLRRGPNPKTLVALAIVVLLLLMFLESIWQGFVMLLLIAAGVLAAAIIRASNAITEP